METRDLRIGNYLEYNGNLVIISNISYRAVNLVFDPVTYKVISWVSVTELQPLAITKERLYALGFSYTHNYYVFSDAPEPIYIKRKINTWYFSVKHFLEDTAPIISIHQLQNLVYAMFGIELVFKRNRRK